MLGTRGRRSLLVASTALIAACGCGSHAAGEARAIRVAAAPGEEDAATEDDRSVEVAPGTTDHCPALPAPGGRIIRARPSQGPGLADVVQAARPGDTVLLEDGVYELRGATVRLAADGVTIRSASGDRDRVVIDGGYESAELVAVHASNVTVADLTVRRAASHPIHVAPSPGRSIRGVRVYNVVVLDPGQQGIKVNQNGDAHADEGLIACSRIELTDEGRPHVWRINGSCYTGGIDLHQARGWVVRDNRISGFFCDRDLSEHGVHAWTGSRDTVVERNVVLDCARGIGFGMRTDGVGRRWSDTPCPGVGSADHYGGIIRNNFVAATRPELFASEAGFDGGIALWAACGARVVHNTVFSTRPPFASIEWRYPASRLELLNNLVSHPTRARDGAAATARGNVEGATAELFRDPARGDLRLRPGAGLARDPSARLEADLCPTDIDGQRRGEPPTAGADERPLATPDPGR